MLNRFTWFIRIELSYTSRNAEDLWKNGKQFKAKSNFANNIVCECTWSHISFPVPTFTEHYILTYQYAYLTWWAFCKIELTHIFEIITKVKKYFFLKLYRFNHKVGNILQVRIKYKVICVTSMPLWIDAPNHRHQSSGIKCEWWGCSTDLANIYTTLMMYGYYQLPNSVGKQYLQSDYRLQ